MDKSRITCAIWPWGTKAREEMEKAAREITEIGYETFESTKAAIYAYDLDLDAYREVLNRYSLKPVSFYFHMSPKEGQTDLFENLEKELEFVAALGVKTLNLQGTRGRPDPTFDGYKEDELNRITKFAKIAREYGLTTCIHPHYNTWVMFEDEIDYVLQNTDDELLAFGPDTAHLVAGECDPVDLIRRYADRVKFTHLKDIKTGQSLKVSHDPEGILSDKPEVFSNFSELGKGDVDFKGVFQVLNEVKYQGYHCVELDKAPVSNAQSARNNFAYLQSL